MRIELYRDEARCWRWRAVHQNGRIQADSGEGYRRRIDAVHGLAAVAAGLAQALALGALDFMRERGCDVIMGSGPASGMWTRRLRR